MFNATVNVGNGVSFQVSADTEVDIFKAIARIQSTFNFNTCGACNSTNVFFRVRTTENDEDYLEMVCPDCGARLPFGVTKKEKQIFPKLTWNSLSPKQQENRKDEEDYANSNYGRLPNRGWYKFRPNKPVKMKKPKKQEEDDDDEDDDTVPF